MLIYELHIDDGYFRVPAWVLDVVMLIVGVIGLNFWAAGRCMPRLTAAVSVGVIAAGAAVLGWLTGGPVTGGVIMLVGALATIVAAMVVLIPRIIVTALVGSLVAGLITATWLALPALDAVNPVWAHHEALAAAVTPGTAAEAGSVTQPLRTMGRAGWTAVGNWWHGLASGDRNLLLIALLAGAGAGILMGIATVANTVMTSCFGGLLMFATVGWLIAGHGLPGVDWLVASAVRSGWLLLTVILIGAIGQYVVWPAPKTSKRTREEKEEKDEEVDPEPPTPDRTK
ncbi:MAG: hypothetical protein R3336_07495 [Phycisphaeraceae bacterium]|nr:hypothetical protein [Phycisphaeraceae bacterium]